MVLKAKGLHGFGGQHARVGLMRGSLVHLVPNLASPKHLLGIRVLPKMQDKGERREYYLEKALNMTCTMHYNLLLLSLQLIRNN
jgi:hypothetical protein